MQVSRDYGELDMANPQVLSDFLKRAYTNYPPAANRKYMLVFWDHGSGWSGYGVDHTCSGSVPYDATYGCNILSLPRVGQGRLIAVLRIT